MFHRLVSGDEDTDHCFRCGQSFENLNDDVVLSTDNAPSQWVNCPGPDNVGTHHWVFRMGMDGLNETLILGVECERCSAFIDPEDSPYPPEECDA